MLLSTDTASRYILMANTNPAILHAITCNKYQIMNFRDKIQQKRTHIHLDVHFYTKQGEQISGDTFSQEDND